MRLLIGEIIKERGLKKQYIADKVGVNRDTVTNWCNNKTMPTLEKAVKIANLLGCNVNDLYEIEQKK